MGLDEEDDILLKIQLEDAIKDMPIKLRAVVALLSAGYTQQESARILGITRGAVGMIYKRARLAIEEKLK